MNFSSDEDYHSIEQTSFSSLFGQSLSALLNAIKISTKGSSGSSGGSVLDYCTK